MKKVKFSLACMLLVSFMSGLSGCEGPAGPAGADGVGTQGPKGDKGDKGDTGAANVIYSDWKDASGGWVMSELDGVRKYSFTIAAPALTTEILDKGTVLVYARLSGDNNQVRQLPYHFVGGTQVLYDLSLLSGSVKVWYTSIEPKGVLIPTGGQFRYVLIPGGQAAGRSVAYAALPYGEIRAMFNLPD